MTYQVAKLVADISLPNSLGKRFALMFEQAKSKLSKEKAKVFIQYPDAQSEDRLFKCIKVAVWEKVFYQQHGCSYDSNPIYNHFHELELISSGLVSWGWKRSPYYSLKAFPLPMPAVRKRKIKNEDLIYVTKGSRMNKNLFLGDLRPVVIHYMMMQIEEVLS